MKNKLKTIRIKLLNEREKLIALLPKEFREEFRERSYIGGGAIYSLYNDKEPKDFDFFLDDEVFASKIRLHYSMLMVTLDDAINPDKKIKSRWLNGVRIVITPNGITIGKKYQIITKWVGNPEEVVKEFDFRHNQFFMYKNKIDTLTEWDFLEDNVLRFNDDRPRDIIGCIIRTKKFVERGFTISNREMAKMLRKLSEVGFNERELEILDQAEGNFES